jgi:hypothetical protein
MGCLLCGKDLVYLETNEEMLCYYCKGSFSSNVKCVDGHYICDRCHSMSAEEFIFQQCLANHSTNPLEMAINLMKKTR